MEKKLYDRLSLSNGSKVLDAGAGSGIVASYMAQHGLLVKGVDITPLHVADAQRNIKKRGLQGKVSVRLGDYHDLQDFEDDSMDGIYTMETFVHADDPLKVLQNFYRLLRPGGVLVLNEADFEWDSELLQQVLRQFIAKTPSSGARTRTSCASPASSISRWRITQTMFCLCGGCSVSLALSHTSSYAYLDCRAGSPMSWQA